MKQTCCNHKLSEEDCKDLLAKNGISKTKSKISILLKLSASPEPLSAQQIFERLDSCDLSTVFRTLSQFKEKNLVQEVNLDEGFLRFQLISETGQHHHHFVRCRNCGKISQIPNCDLSTFEKAIKNLGFTHMEHRLEFSGLCSQCS